MQIIPSEAYWETPITRKIKKNGYQRDNLFNTVLESIRAIECEKKILVNQLTDRKIIEIILINLKYPQTLQTSN